MAPSFIPGFYIVVVFFALSSQKSEAPDTVSVLVNSSPVL